MKKSSKPAPKKSTPAARMGMTEAEHKAMHKGKGGKSMKPMKSMKGGY